MAKATPKKDAIEVATDNLIQQFGLPAEDEAAVVRHTEDGLVAGVEIGMEELQVPRLAMVQSMSQMAKDEMAPVGSIVNSLTQEVMWPLPGVHDIDVDEDNPLAAFACPPGVGPASAKPTIGLPFVPLRIFIDRVYFNDDTMAMECRAAAGGMRTVDGFKSPFITNEQVLAGMDPRACGNCPASQWGADNAPPLCNKTINILGFALKLQAADDVQAMCSMPVSLSCMRTSYPTGRQIATVVKSAAMNPWRFMWMLTTREESKDKNRYHVFAAAQPTIRHRQLATPPVIQQHAAAAFDMLQDTAFTVDQQDLSATGDVGEAPPPAAAPTPEPPPADAVDGDPFGDA